MTWDYVVYMKETADRKERNTALFSSSVGWGLCFPVQWHTLHVFGSIQKWNNTFQDLAFPTNCRSFRGRKKKKESIFLKTRLSNLGAAPPTLSHKVQCRLWHDNKPSMGINHHMIILGELNQNPKHVGPHTNTQPLREFLKSQQYGKKGEDTQWGYLSREVVHRANSRCGCYWFKAGNPWN